MEMLLFARLGREFLIEKITGESMRRGIYIYVCALCAGLSARLLTG